MKVSIIVPTYNHLEDALKPCLESIRQHTDLSDTEVIVVANGCTDGTSDYVRSLGHPFKLIEDSSPLGYTKATNLGLYAAKGEYLILLNNDCVLLPQEKNKWVDLLLSPMPGGSWITGPVMMWDEELGRHYMNFFCVAFHRNVMNQIGPLDTENEFGDGYCEDIDWCIKAVNAGFRMEQVPDAVTPEEAKREKTSFPFPISHNPHTTYGPERHSKIDANRQILRRKYLTIEGNYHQRCIVASDIFQHLPVLREYAEKCDHITEMGVRHVTSTYAFLASKPKKLISYDIESCPLIGTVERLAGEASIDFKFHQADVLKVDIEPTDLLFIDTWHCYAQLKAELNLHASKVRNYIVLHDTTSFAKHDEGSTGGIGLQQAVDEFLAENPHWHIKEKWVRNSGITILESISPRKYTYSVVIPTYNHLDDCLKPCIESLKEYTDLSEMEVVIVANGCTDDTRRYVQSLGEPFKLIWLEEASGYTISTNIGIKSTNGTYVILLNNDTIFLGQPKHEWVEKLVAPFKADPSIGATGPHVLYDPYAQSRILIFFCTMIKRDVFDKIGYLDEVFSPGGGEDIDFTVRMERAGYTWRQVPDHSPLPQTFTNTGNFGIYHQNNKTFGEMSEYTRTIIKRNGLVNLKRYVKDIRLKLGNLDGEHNVLTVHPDAHPALLKMPYNKLDFDDGTVAEIAVYGDVEFSEENVKEWSRVLRSRGVLADRRGSQLEKPKIYDTFIFFNEFDVLDIRLQELYEVVDKFVIVEGTLTHSNKPKPLYFAENKDRYAKYADKIIHVVVDDMHTGDGWTTEWQRERDQRNGTMKGLVGCKPDDIIIISDCDEIPNASTVKKYTTNQGLMALKQDLFYFKLNLSVGDWDKARILPYALLQQHSPQEIRENLTTIPMGSIDNGGWHFSYIGGVATVSQKLNSFLHQEFNRPEINNAENIQRCIDDQKDLFGRDIKFHRDLYFDRLPECVKKDIRHYIRKDLVSAPRVFDCFPFFNELDLLEIRLNELDSVVDYFVLCEMPVTHKGDAKPLYFAENKNRFSKWLDRIIYVCPNDYPTDEDPWTRERFQRDACLQGLHGIVKDEDLIIGSDVDEIPRAESVANNSPAGQIMGFEQTRHNYFLNLDCGVDKYQQGVFSKYATWATVKNVGGLCALRYADVTERIIKNAGWHFSYMGGAKRIIHKLESWAHQEWNLPQYKDEAALQSAIEAGRDPLHPEAVCKFIDIKTPNLPQYVVSNARRFELNGLIHTSKPKTVEVTAYISTKDRYFTTLPMAIMSIINQTYPVRKLVIFDDGEHRDLREVAPYREIFSLLQRKGIEWYFLFGERKGQVANHNKAIEMSETTEWLWRIDDDDTPEPNCLERLVKNITPEVGAIGGLVHMPTGNIPTPALCSGDIRDIYSKLNLQWSRFVGVREVDHLHNTFLYRKAAAQHGYCRELSPVGHREETIFTYEMKRAGWKILIDPSAMTWHMRDPNGGIRSHTAEENYVKDEQVFARKLAQYGVKPRDTKLIVLDAGLGDHICFKMVLPEIQKKHSDKRIVIGACYPEVFAGDDVDLISIHESKMLDPNQDRYSVYKYCWDNNWDGSQGNLVEAFRKIYL